MSRTRKRNRKAPLTAVPKPTVTRPPPGPAQPDMFGGGTVYLEQRSSIRGPLPPPEVFAQYRAAAPEAAELILHMAREEQAHRHRMDAKIADGELAIIQEAEGHRHSEVRFGQVGGVALSTLVIASAAALAYFDRSLAAFGVVVGVNLSALLAVFMYGQHQRRKAEKEQPEAAPGANEDTPPGTHTEG